MRARGLENETEDNCDEAEPFDRTLAMLDLRLDFWEGGVSPDQSAAMGAEEAPSKVLARLLGGSDLDGFAGDLLVFKLA